MRRFFRIFVDRQPGEPYLMKLNRLNCAHRSSIRLALTLSRLSIHELLYLKIFVTALTAFSVAVLFSADRLSAAPIMANKRGSASAQARAYTGPPLIPITPKPYAAA